MYTKGPWLWNKHRNIVVWATASMRSVIANKKGSSCPNIEKQSTKWQQLS